MCTLPETMTIGEVAAKQGLRTSALRYYESVGLLPAPMRVSGQRRYEAGILKQVEFIQAAQKVGCSIKEIKTLLGTSETDTPYSERLQKLARQKIAEAEALIAEAQRRKAVLVTGLACCCQSLDDCSLFAAGSH